MAHIRYNGSSYSGDHINLPSHNACQVCDANLNKYFAQYLIYPHHF